LFIPVILSGGAGTRLWPVSRELHPKPFIRMSDGQSLLQKTLKRVSQLENITEILTVTNREFYFKTKDEYLIFNHHSAKNCFLLEPFGRNTAPAIGMAAFYALEKYGPESILLVLPADHLIEQHEAFDAAVKLAYEFDKSNTLVTFGIRPTSPKTGFGYIKLDSAKQGQISYKIEEFVEKPSLELAEKYVTSGQYLWNSGMFCFKSKIILKQLEKLVPDVFLALKKTWECSEKGNFLTDRIEIDAKTFEEASSISIDYAVMEKSKNAVVIPCDFNWSDIGCWNSVSELTEVDAAGNGVVGEALLVDVTNTFIQGNDRLVAAVGLENLIIVDTPDALLVANRAHSQSVKKVVDLLKSNDHKSYKLHRTIFRPWGSYTILDESGRFKIKRIVVRPGSTLSLQMHYHRSEHWIVVSGAAKVTNGSNTFILNTNESTFVPAGFQHRLENPGLLDLVLIEVQTGDYLGEDDIVRFDDVYGRV
jgi:mannose-1-phosphate guanylyltransferase/mannose-6-phosphate isomerase